MNLYRRISVARLRRLANPLKTPPWFVVGGTNFLSLWQESKEAIQKKEIKAFLKQDYGKWLKKHPYSGSREDHLRRIAHYVVSGWIDPIEIDVGVSTLGCHVDWVIQDGNHRFAAALYRGDKEILAGLTGDLNYISELFG
jgi:hypothetical protein